MVALTKETNRLLNERELRILWIKMNRGCEGDINTPSIHLFVSLLLLLTGLLLLFSSPALVRKDVSSGVEIVKGAENLFFPTLLS